MLAVGFKHFIAVGHTVGIIVVFCRELSVRMSLGRPPRIVQG